VPSAEALLEELRIEGKVIPLTGGNGIMDKIFVMDSFRQLASEHDTNPGDPDVVDDPMYYALPNLVIMPATSAANCGVSCSKCYRSYRVGPPPSLYDLVQEMGRVDRVGDLPPGANMYEIHLSVPLFVSLFVCVMSVPDRVERKKKLVDIYEVLSAVMVPTGCQHSAMELYFEQNTGATDKVPCGQFCSYCTGRVKKHAGEFKRDDLREIMMTDLFNNSAPTFETVLRYFKEKKKQSTLKVRFQKTWPVSTTVYFYSYWRMGFLSWLLTRMLML